MTEGAVAEAAGKTTGKASAAGQGTPAMTALEKVEALLHPRNIAIIGATERPNNWAMRTHRNLQRYGFPGALYPVNPKRDEIWGGPCYRSLADLPEPPDHLLILAPAASIPATLREASHLGARSATIISAGFAELKDPASVALTEELSKAIAETGLAISGPNCVGNVNGRAKLMTNFEDRMARIEPGPVALVSQSGGVGMLIRRLLEERCLDCGIMVTTGSELGLSVGDYVEYLAHDPETRVILCYLEGLRDAKRFFRACDVAARAGKPVIVLKVGVSQAGRAASVAHTGALAGSVEAFDAVAARSNVIRANTMDDMIELAEYFSHAKPAKGTRLSSMSTSGGKRGLIVDAADHVGLVFPPLDPSSVKKLEAVLGVGSDIGNPLDAGFAANVSEEAYITSVRTMLEDPNVDMLLLEGELPRNDGSKRREDYLRAVSRLAAESDKPIVYVSVATYGFTDYTRSMRKTLPNVAYLMATDRGCATVAAGMRHAQWVPRDPQPDPQPGPKAAELAKLLDAAGDGVLDEVTAKRVLALYGVPLPGEGLATSADEAIALADRIGYPVVLKIVSPAIPHKTEAGGVLLNLADATAVGAGFATVMRNASAHARPDQITGVLVAQQVDARLELVISAQRDPELGPMLMVGSGGVGIELYKDYALSPIALDRQQARTLVDRCKAGRIVAGYRGAQPLDRDAIADVLLALAQLMADGGERLVSVEINPFAVNERGGVCLDALIETRGNAV